MLLYLGIVLPAIRRAASPLRGRGRFRRSFLFGRTLSRRGFVGGRAGARRTATRTRRTGAVVIFPQICTTSKRREIVGRCTTSSQDLFSLRVRQDLRAGREGSDFRAVGTSDESRILGDNQFRHRASGWRILIAQQDSAASEVFVALGFATKCSKSRYGAIVLRRKDGSYLSRNGP